jgi:ribosomal protein L22
VHGAWLGGPNSCPSLARPSTQLPCQAQHLCMHKINSSATHPAKVHARPYLDAPQVPGSQLSQLDLSGHQLSWDNFFGASPEKRSRTRSRNADTARDDGDSCNDSTHACLLRGKHNMSLQMPARRLAHHAAAMPALRARTAPSTPAAVSCLVPYAHQQRRSISWLNWGLSGKKKNALSKEIDKVNEQDYQKKVADRMQNRTAGDSVFDEEIKELETATPQADSSGAVAGQGGFSRAREHMARALDPDPRWRVRWQRRKVMQMVRSGGKLTKEQRIRMSEKEITLKSESLPTSTKKLMFLTRQIAGKTVDDAITQMRYSKKKPAPDVMHVLKEARDRAIVSRGMNLGQVNGQLFDRPRKIQTKDGRWLEVADPTSLYVAQAWVGKGPPRGARMQYHARGRMSRMLKPTARKYCFDLLCQRCLGPSRY